MDGKRLAERAAAESIVLLRNEAALLPLARGRKVALFGRAQIDTIYSGNGSGAVRASNCKNILEECERKGLCPEPGLKAYYQERFAGEEKPAWGGIDLSNIGRAINSGIMYELFGKYNAPAEEYRIPRSLLEQAAGYTDTAILVIGRNSGGEECDRHLRGDYELTDSEEELVRQVCGSFRAVILLLNVNGLIDLAWTERYQNVRSILFLGIPGEEGASAVAEILTGSVNPSGKLAFTIAKRYDDYPAAPHFSWDKDHADRLTTYESYGLDAEENGSTGYEKSPVTLYWEDIYAGYRYFDTFGREPLFPFGHGLSYTSFEMGGFEAAKKRGGIEVGLRVKNTGGRAGKEAVQLYLARCGRGEHPLQELKGFEKTRLLEPGAEEELRLLVPWREWSRYDEERAAWVISKGEYRVLIGVSSRNTEPVASVCVEEDILLEQCRNRLGIRSCNRGKVRLLSRTGQAADCGAAGVDPGGKAYGIAISLCKEDVATAALYCGRNESGKKESTVEESGWEKTVRRLSVEQLAALCVGYGPGTPFAAFGSGADPETICGRNGVPLTTNSHPTGKNGYVSPAILKEGIYSVSYQDGPAGIGVTAWPSGMLLACAFDKSLWYDFGNAAGAECEERQVDVWLAPAVNLQRHPLGGRNFEYLSEDPYLTGICACRIAKGVRENHPVLVCPKHFALNEQETFRRGSAKRRYDAADSIVSERAARELYLRPFEMLVREAGVICLMTSFNKINGVFAAGNADLCKHILREEWGYRGVVVTDWGDMDIVADGADAVAAGNDVVMPGGPPVIGQILRGYEEGRVAREDLEKAVAHLLVLQTVAAQREGDVSAETAVQRNVE